MSLQDRLLTAGFALLCVAGVWILTRVDRTQTASRIWLGKAGWFTLGILFAIALPFLGPVLERLFA
jgi:hypothetical protein